ncbi:MAG: oligosaccharide repeat unit polymerase [Symploca sp. SIO2C1]|nr:oligosaccharide repeat unit polymerase [Symploca sp. SIO2C1]
MLLFPLIFYKPSYGWFHPLIFPINLSLSFSLISIVKAIIDPVEFLNTPIGLEWHVALSNLDQEQLTILETYEQLLTGLGIISYYFGFFLTPSFGIPQLTFSRPQKLGWKLLPVIIFSIVVFAIYIRSQGGINAHLVSWAEGRAQALAGEGVWISMSGIGALACIAWFAADRTAHLNPLFWSSAAVTLSMNFLTKGSRGSVIVPIAISLFVWMLREKKIPTIKIVSFLIIGMILFSLLGNFRRGTQTSQEVDWNRLTDINSAIESAIGTEDKKGEIEHRTGAQSGTLAILGNVPKRFDFLYGESYVTIVTFPIPRALWSNKPRGIGARVGTQLFGTENAGIPPGMVGEGYWNFGISGVILIHALFGCFHQWLVKVFKAYHKESVFVAFYLYILVFLPFTSTKMSQFAVQMIPAIFMLRLAGVFSFKKKNKKVIKWQ